MYKNIWPRKQDFIIVAKSILQAVERLPLLIKWNALIIIVFLISETGYFRFLIIGKIGLAPDQVNEIINSIIQAAFSMMRAAFLIFLIPFQLHNHNLKIENSSEAPLIFKSFLKRTIWPVIIDPIKALLIVFFYFIMGLLLGGFIIWLLINYLDGPRTIAYILLFSVFTVPSIIRAMQFSFIPFVIFFNKSYIQDKISSLKLSTQISKGLPLLLMILYAFIYYIFNQFVSLSEFLTIDLFKAPKIVGITIQALFNTLRTIILISVFYLIYVEKIKTREQ